MPNMENHISTHNRKIIRSNLGIYDNPPKGILNCSCPRNKKQMCPLNGRCLDVNIVYQATIENKQDKTKETYVGITSNTFKARLATHKQSFNNRNTNQTTLSKHIWELKDKKINYDITYKFIGRGQPYKLKTDKCLFCL